METLNKLHNFYNGQMIVMERPPIEKSVGRPQHNYHLPHIQEDSSEEIQAAPNRFLLTSLLMSDPPGPPESDIWMEAIQERRKTTSPLLGL